MPKYVLLTLVNNEIYALYSTGVSINVCAYLLIMIKGNSFNGTQLCAPRIKLCSSTTKKYNAVCFFFKTVIFFSRTNIILIFSIESNVKTNNFIEQFILILLKKAQV